MIEEGKELAKIAPNVVVKVPMTTEGLKAVKAFSDLGIRTNVTLVFSAVQALLPCWCNVRFTILRSFR